MILALVGIIGFLDLNKIMDGKISQKYINFIRIIRNNFTYHSIILLSNNILSAESKIWIKILLKFPTIFVLGEYNSSEMVVLEIFPRIFLSPKIIFVQFFDFKIITEGTAKFFKYFRKYYNNISATIFFHFFQKNIIAKQRNNTEKMIQREKNFKHFSLSKISWIAENIVETRAARAVSTGINLIESSHSRLTFISRSPHCRATIEARSFAFVAIATD